MFSLLFAAVALVIPAVQPGVPNRQPALAAGSKSPALVFGSSSSIWYTRFDDQVQTFSKPIRIADVPGLLLGRHRGPRVAVAGNNVVVTAVRGGQGGDLLAWRSMDGGTTWLSKPVTINDEPRAAREGLQNLAVDSRGTIAVVWLDLRDAGTRLYGAFSRDRGETWSKNVPLYIAAGGTICQCCHPSIAANKAGQFEVMFRNVVDGSRDMYAATWTLGKGVSGLRKQGTGFWKIDACPMDGGGIAIENHKPVSAWRRGHEVILARQGKPEQVLGNGKDVALTETPAGAFVSWTDPTGAVLLRKPGAASTMTLDEHGAFPVLQAKHNGALAAWEDNGSIAAEFVMP